MCEEQKSGNIWKEKFNVGSKNSKDKNMRLAYRHKLIQKASQAYMIIVKKGDREFNSILNRWKKRYCQLLNVH